VTAASGARPPLTLRARLVWMTAALLGGVTLFMILYLPAQLRREAFADTVGRAQIIAKMSAFSVSPAVVFRDAAVLEEGLAGARRNPDLAFIAVTDTSGALLGGDTTRAAREGIAAAANGDVVRADLLIVGVPVESNGREIGRLWVGLSLRSMLAQVRTARAAVAVVIGLLFAVAMAAVVGIASYLTRPLEAMVASAEAIAAGERSHRAAATGSAEVTHLATAFNRMLDGLVQAQRQLEESNRTLETRVVERTAQLEQARDQLLQAQKMEAVGRLAGGVAHDFNNLLTVIIGNAELALDVVPQGDRVRADLKEVQAAAERGKALAQQLLAFGRKQMLQAKVLDLNRLVGHAHQMLRRLIGEDVELRVIAGPRLAPVRADAMQLQQVIMNLAVNARDAMPDGGVLTIETANAEVDTGYTRAHPPMTPGSWVRLTVRDSGVGMSDHVKEHLFEPFFTTKEVGKGTGLGLATVYGIVKQSGGFIYVESAPGSGATFDVFLPPVAAESRQEPGASAAPLPGGTETILVVEDELPVRRLACRVLAARGYEILAAGSGDEALRVAASYEGAIHCLVTDVVMPGMSGPELAERLRERMPDLKVLFTSGYAADAFEGRGGRLPDTPFLGKPYTAEDLARSLRAVLEGVTAA